MQGHSLLSSRPSRAYPNTPLPDEKNNSAVNLNTGTVGEELEWPHALQPRPLEGGVQLLFQCRLETLELAGSLIYSAVEPSKC
jgi:hypothetical protein